MGLISLVDSTILASVLHRDERHRGICAWVKQCAHSIRRAPLWLLGYVVQSKQRAHRCNGEQQLEGRELRWLRDTLLRRVGFKGVRSRPALLGFGLWVVSAIAVGACGDAPEQDSSSELGVPSSAADPSGEPTSSSDTDPGSGSSTPFTVIVLHEVRTARGGNMLFEPAASSDGVLSAEAALRGGTQSAPDVLGRFEVYKPTSVEAFLASYTNFEFADVDPKTGARTLRQERVLSWVFVLHDIPWTGIHGGGPYSATSLPSVPVPLGDAYVMVDARSGEFLFAFTE